MQNFFSGGTITLSVLPARRASKFHTVANPYFAPLAVKRLLTSGSKTALTPFPKTTWQHITFTMPSELWNFFWLNRYLMNLIPLIAANIIKKTYDSWLRGISFYHGSLKNTWRYHIIALLREEFKKGDLKLPSSLKHITSYHEFYSWTTQFYEKTWVVHLNEPSDNMKANVEYLGKYLKRPPLGETRIKHYDGITVITSKVYLSWRTMIETAYKYDPLRYPLCKSIMTLKTVVLPSYSSLLSKHEEIAHGYFPLLL